MEAMKEKKVTFSMQKKPEGFVEAGRRNTFAK